MNFSEEQGQTLYRMSEVARTLGLTREWIRQLVLRGDIVVVDLTRPGQKVRTVRIPERELQRLREVYARGKRTWQDDR